MNRFFIAFITFCFLSNASYCQSLSQVLTTAEKSMAEKNYYDAMLKYEEALQFKENNIDYLFLAAEAARLTGAYKKAIGHYASVQTHAEQSKYPLASYWLGITKQSQGDYEGAKHAFTAYISEHQGEDVFYSAAADKEIKACDWAIEKVNNPVKGTEVNRLGENINSSFSDMSPTPVGKKLYYTSLRFPNTIDKSVPQKHLANIMVSDNDSPSQALESLAAYFPGKSISFSSFSLKSNLVFFAVCEDLNYYDKKCNLYKASVNDKMQWSDIQLLPAIINKEGFTTTHPQVSYNEEMQKEILYFVSNRDGGKGNLDIWYSLLDVNGNFSEPMNASGVNTVQDDISPFYHSKSQTLYYSSKGHLGLGGYDIYSIRETTNGWSTPKNLGLPVNSSLDDVFFVRANDDLSTAYLASNRLGSKLLDEASEACCLDIYKLKIKPCEITLKALVYDAETLLDLNGATLKLEEIGSNRSPVTITSETTNLFEFPIECEKEYRIIATRPGYLSDSVSFNTGKPGELTEITKKIYLKPEKLSLDVLTFFRPDSSQLNGCKVIIWDLTDTSIPPDSITNLSTNLSQFKLTRCHNYKITAYKDGLDPATTFLTADCNAVGKIIKKLYLAGPLYNLLPVEIYFDNDRPNPRSVSTKSALSYSQTYNSYYKKKNEFKSQYVKISNNPDKNQAFAEMDNFFESNLKAGFDTLKLFLGHLHNELLTGKSIEIFIKGYASPRAKSEYNKYLSQRRISSVENEFVRYKNGILRKYINNGRLKITPLPYGEDTAPTGIVDDIGDPKSIYSIEASKERRVEIVDVKG